MHLSSFLLLTVTAIFTRVFCSSNSSNGDRLFSGKGAIKSCAVHSDCTNNLECATDFNPLFSDNKNYTCSVPLGPELLKISESLVDRFTNEFLEQLVSNVGFNLNSLGSPLLEETEVEGVIPAKSEDVQEGTNNHLKEEFGNNCIATFPVIAKEALRSEVNKFIDSIPEGTSDAELKTRKEQLQKDIQEVSLQKMSDFVEKAWVAFKQEKKDFTDDLMAETEQTYGKDVMDELMAETEQSAGQSLQRRERKCGRACLAFINNGPFGTKFVKFIVTVGKGIVNLLRDKINIQMIQTAGILSFAQAISDGDIPLAFKELGKSYTKSFQISLNRVKAIGKGIWKGIKAIGDAFVKFWKFLLTIKPSQWVTLVVAVALGMVMSVVFPPLGLAVIGAIGSAAGITLGATAVTVASAFYFLAINAGLFALEWFLISPKMGETISTGMAAVDQQHYENTKPDSFIDPDGRNMTLDKTRNQFCYQNDHNLPTCFDEQLEAYCSRTQGFPEFCFDNDSEFYLEDGVKTFYNATTYSYNPPFKKIYERLMFFETTYTYDKQRQEYCAVVELNKKTCYIQSLRTQCDVVQGEDDVCWDHIGYVYIEDGIKYYWPESDLAQA